MEFVLLLDPVLVDLQITLPVMLYIAVHWQGRSGAQKPNSFGR